MSRKFSICVLISGRGSNLESLIENAVDYEVLSVFSDNPNALGLEIASRHGIKTSSFTRAKDEKLSAFKDRLLKAVDSVSCDLIVLAGFMQIVPAHFVERHAGRIINIHPSLLPKYPGLHTHERAIESGDKEHGCTVHYLDSGVDTGPIICRGVCDVLSDDSPDTLAARVLKIEHRIYPFVVNQIASGNIRLEGQTVHLTKEALVHAENEGFIVDK